MAAEQYSEEFIRKNAYWLDHNVEARERYGLKERKYDANYAKEQAALDIILRKPRIKNNGACPINPLSSANITSTYNGKTVDRNDPYYGL
jgi:hypothetical protein